MPREDESKYVSKICPTVEVKERKTEKRKGQC